MNKEHEQTKEDYRDTIRSLETDYALYIKIIKIILKDNDFKKIKKLSKYNNGTQTWNIPNFYLKNKTVRLPKLLQVGQETDRSDEISDRSHAELISLPIDINKRTE